MKAFTELVKELGVGFFWLGLAVGYIVLVVKFGLWFIENAAPTNALLRLLVDFALAWIVWVVIPILLPVGIIWLIRQGK